MSQLYAHQAKHLKPHDLFSKALTARPRSSPSFYFFSHLNYTGCLVILQPFPFYKPGLLHTTVICGLTSAVEQDASLTHFPASILTIRYSVRIGEFLRSVIPTMADCQSMYHGRAYLVGVPLESCFVLLVLRLWFTLCNLYPFLLSKRMRKR